MQRLYKALQDEREHVRRKVRGLDGHRLLKQRARAIVRRGRDEPPALPLLRNVARDRARLVQDEAVVILSQVRL